jgi:hypothetical protein
VNKDAFFPELARLGSRIIGRTPEAAAATEGTVRGAIGRVQEGAKKLLNTDIKGTPQLFGPRAKQVIGKATDTVIDNPALALGTMTPVPLGGPLLAGAQKAVEKGIDYLVPPKLAARYKLEGDALIEVGPDGKSLGKGPVNKDYDKKAFAVSQYSGPLNPVIRSGASGLPPFKAPRLDAAIQKAAFATTYSAGPSPDWAHDTAPRSGASSLPPRRAPRLDVAVQKNAAAELEFFLWKFATDANLGQWWEQKGGPHLAKGGSHDEFKKMMDKEKFPDHVKKKFMDVAAKKYPKGHNQPSGGRHHTSSSHHVPGFLGHIAKHPVAAGLAASAGIVGAGYLADRIGDHLEKRRKEKKEHETQKAAAGAPTRGNFMMASDIPSFRPPRLDRAIQKDGELETEPRVDIFKGAKLKSKEKDGDALPDGVALQPWDNFRPVNINAKHAFAMTTEQMAEYVDGLLKEAIPGLTPQSRLEQSTRIGAPAAKAPAAPGPSIADQAKPKGPGFGTGIAGANKGTIGGTNVGGIGNMASVPQL